MRDFSVAWCMESGYMYVYTIKYSIICNSLPINRKIVFVPYN